MAFDCTGNPSIIGGLTQINITSDEFTRNDIAAELTAWIPTNQFLQAASSGRGATIVSRNTALEFQIPFTCDIDPIQLLSVCNATISARLPNGSAVAMRDAWNATDDTGYTSTDGTFTLRFESREEMEFVGGCTTN